MVTPAASRAGDAGPRPEGGGNHLPSPRRAADLDPAAAPESPRVDALPILRYCREPSRYGRCRPAGTPTEGARPPRLCAGRGCGSADGAPALGTAAVAAASALGSSWCGACPARSSGDRGCGPDAAFLLCRAPWRAMCVPGAIVGAVGAGGERGLTGDSSWHPLTSLPPERGASREVTLECGGRVGAPGERQGNAGPLLGVKTAQGQGGLGQSCVSRTPRPSGQSLGLCPLPRGPRTPSPLII